VVAQFDQPRRLGGHLFARNFGRAAQAYDASDVFRGRAQAAFLAAPMDQWFQGYASTDIECADAFGTIQLVG